MPPPDTVGALTSIAAVLGMDVRDARLLRAHGAKIYLLPHEGAVARVAEATYENWNRASLAVALTGWLAQMDFPTVEPLFSAPVESDGLVITVWSYLPQPGSIDRLPLAALGHLLRDLHALPAPPFPLPSADPLARLRHAIAVDMERERPVLSGDQHRWLTERMHETGAVYVSLTFPLGKGLIHNDAHVGNLLVSSRRREGYVLGDWESACWGPREIDLAQEGAPGNRFGLTEEQRLEFSDAYGYDLASWSGWPVLRELRDLHSLAGHLRAAPVKPAALAELQHRLQTLRAGTQDRWHSVA